MNKQELLDLKEDIDKAKDKVNRLEGRKEHLLQELEEEWECESVEEAKGKLSDMKGEIDDMNKQIKKDTEKLEEEYDV